MKPTGKGIKCPRCGGDFTEVRDTRPSGNMQRRRRYCRSCDIRFTTFEMISEDGLAGQLHAATRLEGELSDMPPKVREVLGDLIRTLAREWAATLPPEEKA